MYCSHFGLHRPPFNNTPDPSFYYSTPDHEEALATLQYATLNRKGFVLITGEVGAGKTLIGRMFIRQIDRQASTAVITHTQLNSRQLLAAICSEFELDVPPDATNLQLADRLQDYLLDQFARDRYVVVLLDEGQNLPDDSFEAIRMLGNLEADDAKLLQVCILGQPELRERFKKEGMRQIDQRLFRRFHVPALNRQQAAEYVQRRLSVAGCTRSDLFTPAALDKVFTGSCGIPRVINQICDNALLAAYAQGHATVDESIVNQVLEQEGLTEPAGIIQAARGTKQTKDAAIEEPAYAGETGFVASRPTAQQTQARIEQFYGSGPELIEADMVSSNPSNATTLTDALESLATEVCQDGNSRDGVGSSAFTEGSGQYTLRNVLSGAAQQWPAVRQAIDTQRRQLQRVIDEVSSRPELMLEPTDAAPSRPYGAVVIYGVLISLGLALFISPLASQSPDGLDKTAEQLGFEGKAKVVMPAPMPEYKFEWISASKLSTSIAGAVGTVAVFALSWLLARALVPKTTPKDVATPSPPQ